MANLLFIDDDIELTEINLKYFSKLGYHVKSAPSAQEGIKVLAKFRPDCIILDVMMPGINGFDACTHFRDICPAPIIFLSGKTNETDRIKGLMIGADDYMIKPYSFKELTARILVQIRRYSGNTNDLTISYPPITLDLNLHKSFCNGEEFYLSNREYALLNLLMLHPNKTVTYEEIGEAIWSYYSEAERRTIMVVASRLRKKLKDSSKSDHIIETVRSKGYKFIVPKEHS